MATHRASDGSAPPVRAGLFLILAAASWGFGTVIAKRAVAEIPTFTLLALQLASAVVALVLLMRWRGLPLRDASAPAILRRLGLLNPGAAYALSLLGLASISVSLSVLLWALEPLLIVLLAVFVLGERVGRAVVGLSVVAICGLVAVAQPALSATAVGVALTVAGVACCAVYTILVRRAISPDGAITSDRASASDTTAQVVLAQEAWALGLAVVMVVVVGATGQTVGLDRLSVPGLVAAVTSGVLYYAVAYWFYLSALRLVPASIASASFYLVPVFGVAGAFAFLGDRLSTVQWTGVVIAATAVIAILRRTLEAPSVLAGKPAPTAATEPARLR